MPSRNYTCDDATLITKINIFCNFYYRYESVLTENGLLPAEIELLRIKNNEFDELINDSLNKSIWRKSILQRRMKKEEIAKILTYIRKIVTKVFKEQPFISTLFTFGLLSRITDEQYVSRVESIAARCLEYSAELSPMNINAEYIATLLAKNTEFKQLIASVPVLNNQRKQFTAERVKMGNTMFEEVKYCAMRAMMIADLETLFDGYFLYKRLYNDFLALNKKSKSKKKSPNIPQDETE